MDLGRFRGNNIRELVNTGKAVLMLVSGFLPLLFSLLSYSAGHDPVALESQKIFDPEAGSEQSRGVPVQFPWSLAVLTYSLDPDGATQPRKTENPRENGIYLADPKQP
jgi:hypothetical protein